MPQTYIKPAPFATGSSFPGPVPAPIDDPFVGPFVYPRVPATYMLVVLGALSQLLQPFAWRVGSDSERNTVLDWMDTLIGIISQAEGRAMSSVAVTIHAGSATGTATASFTSAFSAAPIVVVSSANGDLIASWESVTTSGFTARLTANTPVPGDVTATVSYLAAPAS